MGVGNRGGTASKLIKDRSFVRSEELIRSTIKQVQNPTEREREKEREREIERDRERE